MCFSAVWTIYALSALLSLTVIAMLAKLLLHITVKYVNFSAVKREKKGNQFDI